MGPQWAYLLETETFAEKGEAMKATTDKAFLLGLGRAVHYELRRRRVGTPLRLKSKPESRVTNTDGWLVSLGTFAGYQSRAEIWLDHFTAHPTRKIYYGLHSYQKNGVAKLAKAAQRQFGEPLSIYESDWDDDADEYRLAKRLAKTHFGHPVLERYPAIPEFLYGIYEYEGARQKGKAFDRLVERVADFFQFVAESVSDRDSQPDTSAYQGKENRKAVTRHLSRERKSYMATLRKQSDDYICQACGFDFSKFYGTLGNDFAEAHHLVPLSSNNKLRTTSIDDLITVCANCHRMLHRMSGNPKDVAELRSRIRRGKRAN
jgi:hypothetical protein